MSEFTTRSLCLGWKGILVTFAVSAGCAWQVYYGNRTRGVTAIANLPYAPEWQLNPAQKFHLLVKENLLPQVIVITTARKGDLKVLVEISKRVVNELSNSGIENRPGIHLRMLGMFTLLFPDVDSGLRAIERLGKIEGVMDYDVDIITYIDYPQTDPYDIDTFDE